MCEWISVMLQYIIVYVSINRKTVVCLSPKPVARSANLKKGTVPVYKYINEKHVLSMPSDRMPKVYMT